MDETDLLKLLQAEEWNDLEFKEASKEVPKSSYDTGKKSGDKVLQGRDPLLEPR
jgi:hypothetical protein